MVDRENKAFLESYDPDAFERPSVTVDLVLMTVREGLLQVLLGRRNDPPEKGKLALPGGFVGIEETLDQAADRILWEKAGLSDLFVEQLYSFGALDRDPRMRIITVAYFALVPPDRLEAAIDVDKDLVSADIVVPWGGEAGGPVTAALPDAAPKDCQLAFDHAEILGMAVKRLRGRLDYSPIGFELLPKFFTLRELQSIHEAILGQPLNKPAFRRKMLDRKWLKATGKREQGVTYRPAELYRFDKRGAKK